MNATNLTYIYNATCLSHVYDQAFLEPTPKWDEAKGVWGWAWQSHIYILGCLFAILSILGCLQTVISCVRSGLPSRMCYIMLNLMVTISSLSRTANFFLDPYNSECKLPRAASYFLLHISTPCITSSFILILALLIQLSKYERHGKNIFNPVIVVIFIMFNFMVAITADMVTAYFTKASLFLVICFSYFLLVGLVISGAYMYVFWRYYSRIVMNRKVMQRMQITQGGSCAPATITTKVPLAVKVALVASSLFLLICLTNIFYLVSMLMKFMFHDENILLGNKIINQSFYTPLYWFIYQSVMRVCDVMLCGLVLFVAGLPLYKGTNSVASSK